MRILSIEQMMVQCRQECDARYVRSDEAHEKEKPMANCRKCSRPVNDCGSCNGGRAHGIGGKLTCSKCNNTGSTCNEHGGHWK